MSCQFELHYFEGPPTESQFRDKNVLYIPGGPGDIVDRKNAALDFTDINANYIYFDVRATGYSLIPESNVYDQFLRAKYVVEDIEALRKQYFNECSKGEHPIETGCEQKRKPWDAIYAHSWGTIVAQMYAKTYPESVNALILSAPVSRASGDTGAARRTMIVDNLIDIYRTYRTTKCSWPSDDNLPTGFSQGAKNRHPVTENFCFLEKDTLKFIENKLKALLNQIEREYGSTSSVIRFYNKLIKEDNFKKKYPYPAELFKALRWLEWFGAGEKEGFRFFSKFKQQKLDAVFFLGYYLMLDSRSKPPPTNDKGEKVPFECDVTAPFVALISDREKVKDLFCGRIQMGESALAEDERNDHSLRAGTVFGIFDGVARWIVRLLEEEKRTDNRNCFKVGDLHDIATGKLLPEKKAFQEVIKQMGIMDMSSDEEICPWDPRTYLHEIPTLILAGGADPVTAGGQARSFYENGLTHGKRAFIEFQGVGHLMTPQMIVDSVGCEDKKSKESSTKPKESEEEFADRLNRKFGQILINFVDEASNIDAFITAMKDEDSLCQLAARLGP
jgi:pimeloyl-ACP methyl ester carboxylesterase